MGGIWTGKKCRKQEWITLHSAHTQVKEREIKLMKAKRRISNVGKKELLERKKIFLRILLLLWMSLLYMPLSLSSSSSATTKTLISTVIIVTIAIGIGIEINYYLVYSAIYFRLSWSKL